MLHGKDKQPYFIPAALINPSIYRGGKSQPLPFPATVSTVSPLGNGFRQSLVLQINC
jgi:hypothetical protein